MTTYECDVAVIGAGTAGLAAERKARDAGASTLIVDPEFSGTTCATVGCMPSKLLIAAATAAWQTRGADAFGLRTDLKVDGPAVMRRLRALRDDFAAATRKSIDSIPLASRLIGHARFVDARTLAVGDDRVRARAIVIATGARPNVPKMFDPVAAYVLTNETVFELADLPRSLAVIGGGPEGLELAQAMARLGVDVQVFDSGQSLAGLHTEDSVARIREILARDMPIHLGADLEVSNGREQAELRWKDDSGSFDKVLVAAGRSPALEGLDLHLAGIPLDEHGTPTFDAETMQCGGSMIFIAGDANHDRAILHEATDEGTIAGANAASYPEIRRAERKLPLTMTFTHPAIATVGDMSNVVGRITATGSWSDQGRARVENEAEGFVTLHADREDGRLRGAFVFLHGGEHIAHYLSLAISMGMTASNMLDQPIYHPTLLEGLKAPLRKICEASGPTPPWSRSGGFQPGD